MLYRFLFLLIASGLFTEELVWMRQEKKKETPPPPKVIDAFYPPISDGINFFMSADLLLFCPNEPSIAMTNKPTPLFTRANVTEEPVIDPNFEWDLGFRLGMGGLFAERKWDVSLSWLRYDSDLHQKRSTAGNLGAGMFPIWSLASDILPFDWVSFAKMHWELNLNLLDLNIGYSFDFKKRFFLRPFFGLRSAWVDQHSTVNYGGGIFANGLNLPNLGSTFGYDHISMKNNFWGLGPILGIQPELSLGWGLQLYGSVAASVPYGYFDLNQTETYLQTVRFESSPGFTNFRWILDAAGGLYWKTFFKQERYALTVGLGWEYHLFFNQIEWKTDAFDLVSDDRNLSLNGASLSLRFDL